MAIVDIKILHLLRHIRIHDVRHANDPVDDDKGGGYNGADEMSHYCRSSQPSLSFDALFLLFAAVWLFVWFTRQGRIGSEDMLWHPADKLVACHGYRPIKNYGYCPIKNYGYQLIKKSWILTNKKIMYPSQSKKYGYRSIKILWIPPTSCRNLSAPHAAPLHWLKIVFHLTS